MQKEIFSYNFNDPKLLEEALTHPSVDGDNKAKSKSAKFNYERLEFLGDSVLGICIAEMLYKLYPNDNEGELHARHSSLICGEMISKISRESGMEKLLITGKSFLKEDIQDSILEDVMESVLGAIYLDGGLNEAKKITNRLWLDYAKNQSSKVSMLKDPKMALQEWTQSKKQPLPKYILKSQTGPDHDPLFTIEVVVENLPASLAQGKSRKNAEQNAARNMLEYIEKNKS